MDTIGFIYFSNKFTSDYILLNTNVFESEVQAAQETWGKALIQIGKDFESGGIKKAKETANTVLDAAHGYNLGTALFKPTLTQGSQVFRTTKEGALAYFVGDNSAFPNDSGFALKGWQKYEFKNAGVFINGNMARVNYELCYITLHCHTHLTNNK